ncbi:MAG: prepilin-type N-terminal cleavage/methylation domain-containing protein [Pseudomonadota bacterium]
MRREKGATLMEALVALAITALLAASVAQIAGFGLRVVERGERASSATAAALRDERLLREALTRADGAFEGDATGFRWRGPGADADAASWRLLEDGRIAPCAAEDCGAPRDWLAARPSGFAYAGADGVFGEDWRGAAPPHAIRIDFADRAILVAPRIRGAE